jgi:hypothetical protein
MRLKSTSIFSWVDKHHGSQHTPAKNHKLSTIESHLLIAESIAEINGNRRQVEHIAEKAQGLSRGLLVNFTP